MNSASNTLLARLRCISCSPWVVACAMLTVPWMVTDVASRENCVDVALVLAVDGSGSINTEEFHLQRQAIVSALRDPGVLQAIDNAGSVAATVLFWGDPAWPVQETGFVHIEGQQDVEVLVTAIESMPRRVLGNTGLSMGLSAALDRLETVRCAHRSVINVSADGSDTVIPRRKRLAPSLREVRARAEALNVTINALIISSEEHYLKSYFEKQVITGPEAFVMEIGSFSDYAEALRRKLMREIAPVALSHN
jgi:hypothetical protein